MNHYNNAYLANIYSQHLCTDYKDYVYEDGWARTWDRTTNLTRRILFADVLKSDWLSDEQKKLVHWFLSWKGLKQGLDYPNIYNGQWEEIYWNDIVGLIETLYATTGNPAVCYSLSGVIAEDNSSED